MIKYNEVLNTKLLEVFIEVLKDIEKNGLSDKNHLYITLSTLNANNDIPNWLLEKYPEEITILIQHEYYYLNVNKNDFEIGLSFNNIKTDLKISFDSIISFADPSANFGLSYQFNKLISNKKRKQNLKKNIVDKKKLSNIIEFSNLKKN